MRGQALLGDVGLGHLLERVVVRAERDERDAPKAAGAERRDVLEVAELDGRLFFWLSVG